MELRLRLLALTLAVLLTFCGVHSQSVVDMDLRRLCNAQSVCRDCIQASPLCSWCADGNFDSNSFRCYPTGDPDVTCSAMGEQNPRGGTGTPVTRPLEGINQISPASIDVNVRPGVPVTFPLSIRPARNFPIDLYLLMDLSFSMNDDLNNLKRLGADLAASIVGISNNFTIGFGSFVDKRLGPYVNLRPEVQNDPCFDNSNFDNCVSTYSYRHVVRLTPNQTFFNERVQAQRISGNQDAPEGGFDGFLQSIVCTDLIGWRGLSRKLLLYITDAGFHYANDGKLGGVILPHDGLCKVAQPATPGAEVDYNDWDVYDYPSIGQIAEALRRNDIIPIFAAEARARPIYDELVNELGSNGAFSGTLAADSSNVVTLVRDLYNTISQRILFDPQPIPGVSFNITPTNCPGVITADGICTGVQIEQTAQFQVSVSLTECNAENSGRPIDVPIRVVGFGTFMVQLTAVCGCPCEGNPIVNDPACNGQGNLTCGICECNQDRLGDFCQCDAAGVGNTTSLMCPVGPTDIQCTRSDRGTCVCGECICRTNAQGEPEFYGPACECDDSRCGRVDGLLCSGRGTCTCNGCQCNVEPTTSQPYINGDLQACECTPATNCIDPRNNTATCNGRGECGCDGTCQCTPPYSGTYCERCSGSSECTENCDINFICAQCALDVIEPYAMTLTQEEFFSEGLLMREGIPPGSTFNQSGNTYQLVLPPAEMFCDRVMEANRCPTIVIINGTSDVDYEIDGTESVRCEGLVGVCTFRYFVAADETPNPVPNANPFLNLHVEFLRSCPEPAVSTAPWIIAIAIIIPLLVLGLLALLLLKVLLLIFDAIEVKRFEEELARTKYSKNENPLYRSAAKDYENPLYGK